MTIKFITTGGTIDKIYFDASSDYQIGEPIIDELMGEANTGLTYKVQSVLKKDSLDMDDKDRDVIYKAVENSVTSRIIITHGTDTMVETATRLASIEGKTIVLFGAMQPARMRHSDAVFNLGFAVACVQTLPEGVYIAMNGQVFTPDNVAKNRALSRFESIEENS